MNHSILLDLFMNHQLLDSLNMEEYRIYMSLISRHYIELLMFTELMCVMCCFQRLMRLRGAYRATADAVGVMDPTVIVSSAVERDLYVTTQLRSGVETSPARLAGSFSLQSLAGALGYCLCVMAASQQHEVPPKHYAISI
jgi:hypothetical protein